MTARCWLLSVAAVLWPAALRGTVQAPEARGRELAEQAYRHLSSYGDLTVDVTIELRPRRGDARTWTVRLFSLESAGGGEKTIIQFQEPRDARGTALLTVSAPGKDDEQWLYLPAVGRPKRVASHSRSRAFMGTEFSYEDIAAQPPSKYRFRYLREDVLDGVATFVVARYPLDSTSVYTRQVLWIDQEHQRLLRLESYDRTEAPLKSLHFRDYRVYQGRFWRAGEMEMINHRTQASTRLRWTGYRFATGLRARDFEPAALSRIP